MTDIRSELTDHAAIKRYFFDQMTGAERESFEEKLFVNDDLFAKVAAAEDDLIDRYVAGNLSPAELLLFESSLKTMPARQNKVRNARVISEFIRDEKELLPTAKADATSAKAGPWAKAAGLFAFRTPTSGFAFVAFSLLLLVSTFALYRSNISLRDENARLTSSNGNLDELGKVHQLNEALSQAKQREDELKSRVDTESEAKENLTSDLINERENRKKLETEIARLGRTPAQTNAKTPGGQSVQTLLLANSSPQTQGPTASVKLGYAVKQMAIVVKLPDSVATNEQLSVAVNGKNIGGTFSPHIDLNGAKHITVSFAVGGLQPGKNKITVLDSSGTEVTSYSFSADK